MKCSTHELPLNEERHEQIVKTFAELSKLSGALYSSDEGGERYIDHVPFAVLPYEIKQADYERLYRIQESWGKLLVALSHDHSLIARALQQTRKVDVFVQQLYDIYMKTRDQPEKPEFHIIRSDYMQDSKSQSYLLVQYNLIAVSMGGLSDCLQDMSRNYLPTVLPKRYRREEFPQFHNAKLIGDGMAQALKANCATGVVVMVVAANERNVFDQRWIEYELVKHGYEVVRATLVELAAEAKLDETTRTISYRSQTVAMFYFRDGYEPTHYPTEECWKLRENIERSTAISVPTVAMQLVNCKRVQQELHEKFLCDYLPLGECQQLAQCLAGMWNFEDESKHEELIRMTESGHIVLKPNREGGGHNTYGKDVLKKLRELSAQQLKEYVLMERIYPKAVCNILVKNQKLHVEKCVVSELSVYSTVLYHRGQLQHNRTGGWLVRTKPISCDEGGVATGFSVLSSLHIHQ